jgi:transposase
MKKRTTRASGTESMATNSDGAERALAHRLVKAAPGVGPNRTVGMDLGDRTSHFCVLDEGGMVVERGKVQTTREGFRKRFEGVTPMRIALEVGTHSPWVSRLLKELGHEVLVANPRKTRLIYENRGKQDSVDAEALARIARLDPKLLYPVEHRPESVAQDLAVLRARDALVRTRTLLVNHVRGAVKATGYRVKKCSTRTFSDQAVDQIPPEVLEALSSVLTTIEVVSTQILTLEHPGRFRKSRAVGPYLGLVPARSQSGDSDPQLRITKEGDSLLLRLLVQSAQYILGPFGEDCDLRRFGQALSVRGERNAKKRAVVAA